MDNQHEKIKGYRDLSESEIDLINQIKEHGEKTKALLEEVASIRDAAACSVGLVDSLSTRESEESVRCLRLAKEALQTGQMWFVRAVALPEGF